MTGRMRLTAVASLALLLVAGISLALAWFLPAAVGASTEDPEAQWMVSGHSNEERVHETSLVEVRGATAAHCGRCHSEQGFVAWVPQLKAGNPGLLAGPDGKPATVEHLKSLGLTADTARPITCDACHTETYETRIRDSTPMLPAGFQASGVGAGALCMTCHNTRNGRIEWNVADVKRYTAPHHSAQADVIMGQNVYFLDFGAADMVSPHAAFVGDSCVTCHLELGKNGHEFKPSEQVCANCHGPQLTPERVQKPVKGLLAEVMQAFNNRFLALYAGKVARADLWDPETDQTTRGASLNGAEIRSVELLGIHGQMGLKMTMADGRELYSQLGGLKDSAGKPVVPTTDPLVKAGWNYLLVLWDGSYGVHNPSFARTVLLTTIGELKTGR